MNHQNKKKTNKKFNIFKKKRKATISRHIKKYQKIS